MNTEDIMMINSNFLEIAKRLNWSKKKIKRQGKLMLLLEIWAGGMFIWHEIRISKLENALKDKNEKEDKNGANLADDDEDFLA